MTTTTGSEKSNPAGSPPATFRKIPAPRVLPESQPYWVAADAGQLLLKKCLDCGQLHHYPRDICPHCLSANTQWTPSSGTGVIYSFSTMGKGDAAYTLAFVTLDEGITLMTNLVDCEPRALQIGQGVRVVFKASDGGHAVPMFAPLS